MRLKHWFYTIPLRLRSLFRRAQVEQELDEELLYHIDRQIEENIAKGMATEEARNAAHRAIGGVERRKEECRDMRRVSWIEDFMQDVRHNLRTLRKDPGFTAVAVITLALGIGANTAIFSVVNAVLLRPLPYYDPQRLVYITGITEHDNNGNGVRGREELSGAADYIHWQAESKSFDHLILFSPGPIHLTGGGEPEQLNSVRVTANLFPALGVAPQLGRAFTQEEDRPGGEPVAILSHAFWQRRFGGDPGIIGKSLTLDGRSRQVIGVMPPGFKFLSKVDVLLPRALNVQQLLATEGMRYWGNFIGRLKPGVTPEQARSELDAILQRLRQTNPRRIYAGRSLVTPLGERLVGNLRLGMLMQFSAVAFILLIACANVANLLLARAGVRRKEMAIRAAIGAGRARLIRQMLTESLLLSALGAVVGFLLALLGVKALVPLIPEDLAHLKNIGVDAAALGFTFLAALFTGVVVGIIPALQASRVDLNQNLKEGVGAASFSTRKGARRISPTLVIGELALTLALLAGAGLLIKSFLRARAVEPGYNPENLLTMRIPIYTAGYQPAQKKLFYRDLLSRINALPGVKIAAIGPVPLNDMSSASERPKEVGTDSCCFEVSGDYFQAMGIQLRAGRSFTELEDEKAPHVMVINETRARLRFPGENPIGKRIHGWDDQHQPTVVGVAADVKRFGLESGVQDQEVYLSVLQSVRYGSINLIIRTEGNPLNLAPAVRQQVWALNPNLPVVDVMSMEQRLAESIAPRRFQTMLFGIFAAVALVIAAVGIYGVISYAVSQRTHEIGIRLALGAQVSDVLRMVVWRGMQLTLAGVALGLAAALALTRVMKNLLFNVSATDPATFAFGALMLAVVALIASYIPARRATKVDPLQALRHE
jgi:putative ABC transport system permease protein